MKHVTEETTLREIMQTMLDHYYQRVEASPNLRMDPVLHIWLVEQVENLWYRKLYDYERLHKVDIFDKMKDEFRNEINFITNVFTKREEREEHMRVKEELHDLVHKFIDRGKKFHAEID